MVLWFCCYEGSRQKVRPPCSKVTEEEIVWLAFTILCCPRKWSGLNRISHPHWDKICDDHNGQINLRAKQKYEVLSTTVHIQEFKTLSQWTLWKKILQKTITAKNSNRLNLSILSWNERSCVISPLASSNHEKCTFIRKLLVNHLIKELDLYFRSWCFKDISINWAAFLIVRENYFKWSNLISYQKMTF